MAQSARIIYTIPTSPPTTKTLTIPKPRLFINDPFIPREIHTTLTGDTETVLLARMDISVHMEFSESLDTDVRRKITNWWQWAMRGNPFKFAFDSTKTVMTTTTAGVEVVGDTAIDVVDDTGIVNGQQYVLTNDNLYQLVKVTNHSAGNITLAEGIDYNFPANSTFRDQFFWNCVIRNPEQHSPIEDLFDPAVLGTWRFNMDFFEDVA